MNYQYQQERIDQVQFIYYLHYHPLTTDKQKEYLLEFLIDAIAKDEVEDIRALSDEELYNVIRKEGFCSPLDFNLDFEEAIYTFDRRRIITNFDTSGFASNIEVTRLMAEFLRWRESDYTIPLESYNLPTLILLRDFNVMRVTPEGKLYHIEFFESNIESYTESKYGLKLFIKDVFKEYDQTENFSHKGTPYYKLTYSQLKEAYNRV